MSDQEGRIRELKVRIEQESRRAAKAEMERDSASAALAKARKALKDEYKVETTEEAREVLASLEADIEAKMTGANSMLESINE